MRVLRKSESVSVSRFVSKGFLNCDNPDRVFEDEEGTREMPLRANPLLGGCGSQVLYSMSKVYSFDCLRKDSSACGCGNK